MTVATMLGLVACIAVNIWLFRLGVFWGILGLNVTKHVRSPISAGFLVSTAARSPPPRRHPAGSRRSPRAASARCVTWQAASPAPRNCM